MIDCCCERDTKEVFLVPGHRFFDESEIAFLTLPVVLRHEDDKTAAKAFACQQCNKRFTRNDHLERHIESVHEKRKQFECAVCSHQVGHTAQPISNV